MLKTALAIRKVNSFVEGKFIITLGNQVEDQQAKS
jgi:hypothetical protein